MAWWLTIGALSLLAGTLGWLWWRTDRRLADEGQLRADMLRDLEATQRRLLAETARADDLVERLKSRDTEIAFARRVLRDREQLLTELDRTKRQLVALARGPDARG